MANIPTVDARMVCRLVGVIITHKLFLWSFIQTNTVRMSLAVVWRWVRVVTGELILSMVIFIAYTRLKQSVYTQTLGRVEKYRENGRAKELSATLIA